MKIEDNAFVRKRFEQEIVKAIMEESSKLVLDMEEVLFTDEEMFLYPKKEVVEDGVYKELPVIVQVFCALMEDESKYAIAPISLLISQPNLDKFVDDVFSRPANELEGFETALRSMLHSTFDSAVAIFPKDIVKGNELMFGVHSQISTSGFKEDLTEYAFVSIALTRFAEKMDWIRLEMDKLRLSKKSPLNGFVKYLEIYTESQVFKAHSYPDNVPYTLVSVPRILQINQFDKEVDSLEPEEIAKRVFNYIKNSADE